MQANGGVPCGDVQAPGDVGEAGALEIDAANDVRVRLGQRLHQCEGADAGLVAKDGRFEIVRLGCRNFPVALADEVERAGDDNPADPRIDTLEIAQRLAALERSERGTLVDVPRVERGEAPPAHPLEAIAKAGQRPDDGLAGITSSGFQGSHTPAHTCKDCTDTSYRSSTRRPGGACSRKHIHNTGSSDSGSWSLSPSPRKTGKHLESLHSSFDPTQSPGQKFSIHAPSACMPRALDNPPNRFSTTECEYEDGSIPLAELTPIEERAKTILSENDSPDVGFRYSINPYRGCYHACAYCYARPTHSYLGYGAGTDFDRKIVVKMNAPELLEEVFDKRSWRGETIVFSGNTDCYQPLEAKYGLTRALLEVCHKYRNPVGVITKGSVIRRDIDLLAKLARDARCRVTISIAFADDASARAIEPGASPISKRFETLRQLAEAGIPCGVSLAPVIPGLSDAHIPEILERAKDAGASHAFIVLLRLPLEVLPVFDERLQEAMPLRHAKVMNAIREMRAGKMYESEFRARQVGHGERWKLIEQLFSMHAKRLGLDRASVVMDQECGEPTTFRRPDRQMTLF